MNWLNPDHQQAKPLAPLPMPDGQSGLRGWFGNRSIRFKLNLIPLVYVSIALVLLAGAAFAMNISNGVRAYVRGEGLWTKNQKDAVYYLSRYARYKDASDFQKYRQALSVPLGDQRARLELQKPDFDYAVAWQGFLAGDNNIEDIPYLISLFHRFQHVGYMEDAINIWAEADVLINEMRQAGDALHADVQAGTLSPEREDAFSRRIEQLNARLNPIEKEFSDTLGTLARDLHWQLLTLITVSTLLMLATGVAFSTWVSRQLRRDISILHDGTERVAEGDLNIQVPVSRNDEIGKLSRAFNDMIVYRRKAVDHLTQALSVLSATLESTTDGILVVDRSGRISCYNQRFAEMWGIPEFVLKSGNDELVITAVLPQVTDPDGFLKKLRELYARHEQLGFDLLQLKNGRIFERYSRPQRAGEQIVGRIWSFRDITEQKRAELEIKQLAHHDALTQLPNRVLMMDRLDMALQRARRNKTEVALMMIDLDNFKHINDSLGHAYGDRVLLAVAERLNSCARKSDTVARMGGDEFVMILTDVQDRAAIERIAHSVLERVSAPIPLDTHELVTTPSIGLCLFPGDGEDASTLLKSADTAMYQAKANGRGNFQWFTRTMVLAADERLDIETALRRALERNELLLHYQPLVSVASGHVVGMEALLRWQHPRRGLLGPDKFILLAEETGLIIPIGEWVIRSACLEGRRLQQQMGQSLMISINISTRQFRQDNLLRIVSEALLESGLSPQTLVLEITESVLAANPKETTDTLRKIRELGVRIAVDDFGTGYSSLSYITRFPIDMLKIDSSFVRSMMEDQSDAAITSAIIALAHSLKLEVIAEGVESQAQFTFLRERVCNEAQGFFFGRPVPSEDFAGLSRRINQLAASNDSLLAEHEETG